MLRNQFHVLINVSNINDKRTSREDKKMIRRMHGNMKKCNLRSPGRALCVIVITWAVRLYVEIIHEL